MSNPKWVDAAGHYHCFLTSVTRKNRIEKDSGYITAPYLYLWFQVLHTACGQSPIGSLLGARVYFGGANLETQAFTVSQLNRTAWRCGIIEAHDPGNIDPSSAWVTADGRTHIRGSDFEALVGQQFVVRADMVLREIDGESKFYCDCSRGNLWRLGHSDAPQVAMDQDCIRFADPIPEFEA